MASNQTIDWDGDQPRSVATKPDHQAGLRAALRAMMNAPLKATTDAVVDALTHPTSAVYAPAAQDEADRQIGRLQTMRGIADDWAGPGSVGPNEKSLSNAIEFIKRLRFFNLPIPIASIGSHGNAGLFWSDERLYADIEMLEDGRLGYLIQLAGSDSTDNEEDLPSFGLPAGIGRALAAAYLANKR